MDIRIGVIGTGAIGVDHIRRISNSLKGAKVEAVTSRRLEIAKEAAAECGARVEKTVSSLISSTDVDAVLITSPSQLHEEQVFEAIAHGKFVFCEKPLAVTADGCLKVVQAERSAGKSLVQVGFMRRYDKGYRQLKSVLESGKIGRVLMLHCAHRNIAPHGEFTTEMSVTQTAIHEIDIARWLVEDDYVSAEVIFPRETRNAMQGIHDPQLILLRTKSGVLIDIEVFVHCGFGYDIQCEAVCEDGTARLPEPSNVFMREDAKRYVALETDWKNRFLESYDIELQNWIDSISQGEINGPTAWDGYVAAVTADALVRSQHTGKREPVVLDGRPSFYK